MVADPNNPPLTASLDQLRSETEALVRRVLDSSEPIVISGNDGDAEAVLISRAGYEALLSAIDLAESREACMHGLLQAERGEAVPLDKAIASLKARLGLADPR